MRNGYDIDYPVRYLRRDPERGYYAKAARAGEGPGQWFGRGAAALDLQEGREIFSDDEITAYRKVYSQVHPVAGERLRRAPRGSSERAKERQAAYTEAVLAAEPYATADRRRELVRQVTMQTRQAAPYTDATMSVSKSIWVVHVSIRENARQARQAGNLSLAAWFDELDQDWNEIILNGDRAGLRYLEEHAGATRTGSHGTRVGEQESGRWESAGLVVTLWPQHTSRDGDPHDHVHNLIGRMVKTDSDGKWRALDTMAIRTTSPAHRRLCRRISRPG